MQVTGWPAATIARGSVVWKDGEDFCEPGFGRFLARAPYDYIKQIGRAHG